eukprot:540204-Rhodomonas_salina.4
MEIRAGESEIGGGGGEKEPAEDGKRAPGASGSGLETKGSSMLTRCTELVRVSAVGLASAAGGSSIETRGGLVAYTTAPEPSTRCTDTCRIRAASSKGGSGRGDAADGARSKGSNDSAGPSSAPTPPPPSLLDTHALSWIDTTIACCCACRCAGCGGAACPRLAGERGSSACSSKPGLGAKARESSGLAGCLGGGGASVFWPGSELLGPVWVMVANGTSRSEADAALCRLRASASGDALPRNRCSSA